MQPTPLILVGKSFAASSQIFYPLGLAVRSTCASAQYPVVCRSLRQPSGQSRGGYNCRLNMYVALKLALKNTKPLSSHATAMTLRKAILARLAMLC